MSKGAVEFTKDNEYYTPLSVISYFGKFDYDPATIKEKAEELDIPYYDTIDTDGLVQDWTKHRRIWVNPPFSMKNAFIKKAQETYDAAKNEIYVLFPIEFLTTRQFTDSCKGACVYIPGGRVNFQSGLGKQGRSPAFGSVIIKLQDDWEIKFIDINNLKG